MTANTEVLQDTLDRLTTKINRWKQNTWAWVPDGVDPLTEEAKESGVYHDFQLSKDFLEWYDSEEAADLRAWDDLYLPIADCGTSFCVAGDVCVANGYTFVAPIGETYAGQVVKTDELETVLRSTDDLRSRDRGADRVAAQLLGITFEEAAALFHQRRSLPEIWGIGYAVTGGKLKLPEVLPESTRRDYWGDEVPVPATADATETQRAIFEALRIVALNEHHPAWFDLATEKLRELGAVEA